MLGWEVGEVTSIYSSTSGLSRWIDWGTLSKTRRSTAGGIRLHQEVIYFRGRENERRRGRERREGRGMRKGVRRGARRTDENGGGER